MMRDAERRRAYALGFQVARRRAQREIAELQALLDEQRSTLAAWRSAVAERRRLENEMIAFYRNAFHQAREGVSLH